MDKHTLTHTPTHTPTVSIHVVRNHHCTSSIFNGWPFGFISPRERSFAAQRSKLCDNVSPSMLGVHGAVFNYFCNYHKGGRIRTDVQTSRAPTEIHIHYNIAHQASNNKPDEAKIRQIFIFAFYFTVRDRGQLLAAGSLSSVAAIYFPEHWRICPYCTKSPRPCSAQTLHSSECPHGNPVWTGKWAELERRGGRI